MPKTSFMIQDTGSNVGKSMLVAGLCRHFTNQGLKVRPFKPQNMSNNAAVTTDGGEIGRAQALQAIACHTEPTSLMNPVLLKPEGETGSQVIVNGKRLGSYKASNYYKLKPELMPQVMDSYEKLKSEADLVIVEGAGSASEVNLRQNDIANMGFAIKANIPVYLAADIDRGGVIASIIGTHALLPQTERDLIKGFIINKFRGDPALFEPATTLIEAKTNWPSLGVCPWFAKANLLPAEDSQDLQNISAPQPTGAHKTNNKDPRVKVVVPVLPRISNFDDLDPLRAEPNVHLELIQPGTALPGDADLIILTGSKSTIADLEFLYEQGWDIDIKAHIRRGGHVLGLCGGYQMLGNSLNDPDQIEGTRPEIKGLGHLDISTTISPAKTLRQTTAIWSKEPIQLTAYQMHMGETTGADRNNPLFTIDGKPEGAQSASGKIQGTYLHGLFQSDTFRTAYLKNITESHKSSLSYEGLIDTTLDELAEFLNQHLNLEAILIS